MSIDIDTIQKKIDNLKKLKLVLKEKISRVEVQLQGEKTNLSKSRERQKLKHLKSKKAYFKN